MRKLNPNKDIVKTIEDAMGWEEQIAVAENNVIHGCGTHGQLVEDDFTDMMNALSKNAENHKGLNWCFITSEENGIRLMLQARFKIYGRKKLPRKLKKKLFFNQWARQAFLPEYYNQLKQK